MQDGVGLHYLYQRYYDAAVGRFISRDPIRWAGGNNLYGYVGNDPVGGVDPSGLRRLYAADNRRINRLMQEVGKQPSRPDLDHAIRAAAKQIRKLVFGIGKGAPDPPRLKAIYAAIDHLGDTAYGLAGTVKDGYTTPLGNGKWKCNLFVADMWALGAGIGWNGSIGYPTTTSLSGRKYAPGATSLGDAGVTVRNFNVVASPSIGDIVAFKNPPDFGHATLYVGGGLLIYAGLDDVKVETLPYVRRHENNATPVYRRYAR